MCGRNNHKKVKKKFVIVALFAFISGVINKSTWNERELTTETKEERSINVTAGFICLMKREREKRDIQRLAEHCIVYKCNEVHCSLTNPYQHVAFDTVEYGQ